LAAVGYLAAEAEGRDAETSVSEEPLLIRFQSTRGMSVLHVLMIKFCKLSIRLLPRTEGGLLAETSIDCG